VISAPVRREKTPTDDAPSQHTHIQQEEPMQTAQENMLQSLRNVAVPGPDGQASWAPFLAHVSSPPLPRKIIFPSAGQ
jgi:hypothetical protein